jgi:hypothetical protein
MPPHPPRNSPGRWGWVGDRLRCGDVGDDGVMGLDGDGLRGAE